VNVSNRVDMATKKFLFRMISQLREKTQSSQVKVSELWRHYFSMGDEE
jgi:hypothetical protein